MTAIHTDDCTDCGCDETCTAPLPPRESQISRTTEPTSQDIAQATVWLTGVLEYGEQFVIARDRIAKGIAEERKRVLDPVLAEAQDFDAESIMGLTADVEQVWRDAADRIRRVAEEAA